MCRILAILAAVVFGLALTSTLQASNPPAGGKGGAGKGGAAKGGSPAGKGGSSAGKGGSTAGGKGGNAGKNNGTGSKSQGKNGSGKASNGSHPRGYSSRMGNWGPRHWNATYGCWCYYSPDDGTDYYWYAPDQCYYPVGYSPSGRYNYDNQ